MPRAPAEILAHLARHHGLPSTTEPPARHTSAGGAEAIDLRAFDRLVDLTDDDVVARLEARLASDPADPRPALRAELRAFAGHDGACVLAAGIEPARRCAVDAARVSTGRSTVLVIGGPAEGVDEPCESVPFDDFARAARRLEAIGSDLACIVVEPRGNPGVCTDLAARAAAAGAVVVVDESRTAARLAAGVAVTNSTVRWDTLLLGPALAAGCPFAAVLSRGHQVETRSPDVVTAEVALAVTARLRSNPVHDRIRSLGEQLAARFAERCRLEDVSAEWADPAAMPRLRFAGQENAEAPLIAHHFQLELATLGVMADADLALPAEADADLVEAVGAAFEAAVSRIRTLLIEHNSYLSGGVDYVFSGGDPRLRERGIAKYRYPKLAGVDVGPTDGGAIRIAFAPGLLGPVTSSGFYLPTRLRGDFDISLRYQLRTWEPGPDSACLGLFVQNEPSTARYYAQLMSTADRPDELSAAAGLAGNLSGRRAVSGPVGWLRLTRVGDRTAAFHRASTDQAWDELGALRPCTTDDVIVGAKIWSKVRCGGLVADLSDLQIDATIPADQIPTLPPRDDPRHS